MPPPMPTLVTEWHEIAYRHGQILRHAPVPAQTVGEVAAFGRVIAVGVLSARARRAASAADRAVAEIGRAPGSSGAFGAVELG